jgi:cobaltochelatase CobN
MHLLAAQPGAIADGAEAVDLGQTPGDIVVLSAADTELACLAAAYQRLRSDGFPTLRLANLMRLGHPMSVDLYLERTVRAAKLIVVRLLGGRGYWPYGVEQLAELARERAIALALLPGDDQPDPDLSGFGTLPAEASHRLWQYLVHGGMENAHSFLAYAASRLGAECRWQEPRPLLRAGLYWPGLAQPTLDDVAAHWRQGTPRAAVVFYRALVQAGNVGVVDALIEGMQAHGLDPVPMFVSSLKDPVSAAALSDVFARCGPSVVLNATGFAVSAGNGTAAAGAHPAFGGCDAPVLQVVLAGSDRAAWASDLRGLSARDIAMNVALPEVDGRIVTRAVSFKGRARHDEATETDIIAHEPLADRVAFTCRLAAAWTRLRDTPAAHRRVALVLANYPNQDGRLGNGVGLDTPASAVLVLHALAGAGYRIEDIPQTGNALVERLQAGPTNDLAARGSRVVRETLSMAEYQIFYAGLPEAVRARVSERWGAPEADPHFLPGELDCGRFAISAFRCGNVAVGLQPARGYNIDPAGSYHDPDLPPPHGYLAFYAWLREEFGAHALVHLGKHGNLEWLPGKALALSESCFPEAALGPLPHLYPFIVNDPGEGTQAKRRAQAVIVDHLTPPLTRAESYGPLKDLEQLVDEYYEAAGVDPRRLRVLAADILDLARSTGIEADCGIGADDDTEGALGKLDRYLCEIKELQIRDGLHVFGRAPEGTQARDLLVALARVPRAAGAGADASLIRALAEDLALPFDPLACDMAEPWAGPRPEALGSLDEAPWRTAGDTVERLERLAADVVAGAHAVDSGWPRTQAVSAWIDRVLRPAVAACGPAECAGLLIGLDGRFVAPGPSGAPTRGRPEVLPTGRNFYSVDTRTVPTPAAWTLGWKSAALLVERFVQDNGEWPRQIALTAWGTSNMRTGGDDIAQALALLGVRPTWDSASRRITGFEILPLAVLDRPRVDVTLRISGFFRDAFPGLIDLFDSAVRAVAALDEAAEDNPMAERVHAEANRRIAGGEDPQTARLRAGARVFGSKPGAYGAGLQAMIDERGWTTDADLAAAYLSWGSYAYGSGQQGEPARGLLETRLKAVQAVVQNQDNREHDVLDSDDYYQFEGGMTAAVRVLSGAQPTVYHPDHSRPETPAVRTLGEEVGRVVRARVVNPKWIQGVMRHGYKGAFEMAATVDYMFAFAATARCVADHHFDAVYDAYLGDDEVREFLRTNNPAALKEIGERLLEAQDRGLWRPKRNSAHDDLRRIAQPATPMGGRARSE